MEMIEMNVNYAGGTVHVSLSPEDHFLGTIYPVELNGNYTFTICFDEEQNWVIMREPNGLTPDVDNDLLRNILKKLEQQLRYAA
jgi:hypothetical protein